MEDNKINILIVGTCASSYALAKKLYSYLNTGKIYVSGNSCIKSNIYECIDIREDDLTGLLKFCLENNIHLTIPVCDKALKTDIVSFFHSNGQNIFAPSKYICDTILNKISCRKFLYKNGAKGPKFAIFNKFQNAIDYLKTSSFPVLIKCQHQDGLNDDRMICPTIRYASDYMEKLFTNGETDVLIEDYIYGNNFTIYYITDGYSALPITSVANYKFENGDCEGTYTDGVGCYCPYYRVTKEILDDINQTVNNILESFQHLKETYIGILGIECILKNDGEVLIEDIKPFLQNHDAHSVLNLIEGNLLEIFQACINGAFSDDFEQIQTNNLCTATIVVSSDTENQLIKGIDNIEDIENLDFINAKQIEEKYLTTQGQCFAITRFSKTLTRAKHYLAQDLSVINFNGMKYRKDIISSNL